MSKRISFIHTADLHLDSPFKGLSNVPEAIFQDILKSTFVALDRIVSIAIDREVDFVLIVGDLFDNERQGLKAQIRLRRAFEELNKHNINVYLSYGNHDHINGNVHPVTYPSNVFVFNSEKVEQFIYEKDGKQLAAVQGFSYENRAVIENKTHEYKIINPAIPFHLAMLHGSIKSNTDHDTYAPFQLSELLEKSFDYWALGHIHQRQILKDNPLIVYPGNTQGRSKNETGEKGCYHVILTETEREVSFIPVQAIQFNILTMDISQCKEVHDLEYKIQNELLESKNTTPQLIELNLTSHNQNLTEWKTNFDLEEVIELVNEIAVTKPNWNYIYNLKVTVLASEFDETSNQGDHFIGELSKQFNEQSIQVHLTDLFKHKQGRKYLEKRSEMEEYEIKKEAKQLLFNELLNYGGDFN